MTDLIRGTVTKVLNGDLFEIDVNTVVQGDPDTYDDVERVRIASLSDEIESHSDELEEAEPIDEEETTGTPEEASIQTGSVDSTRFYGIRDVEDLQARLLTRQVECRVRYRNSEAQLVSEVLVL